MCFALCRYKSPLLIRAKEKLESLEALYLAAPTQKKKLKLRQRIRAQREMVWMAQRLADVNNTEEREKYEVKVQAQNKQKPKNKPINQV